MTVRERFLGTLVTLTLGFAMMTGVLVIMPDGAVALSENAWIRGVVDDGADPVPGVYVKVMLFTAGGMDVGYDFTDASGEYMMGVPGGFEYMVIAANGSYYMSMTMVDVMVGETGWANLTLDTISPLVADVTIKGYVLDDYGAPAVGGHVLGISNDPMGGDMPFYANVTQPDVTGYFEANVIESVTGGGAVAFDNPGYQMVDNSTDTPLISGETYWFNITLTTSSANDDARISGQVTDGGTGLPIEDVLVVVDIWNMYLSSSYMNFTFTDSDGNYEMNVTNGTADIWFTKGGYSMGMFNEEDINPGDDLTYDVSLRLLNCVVKGNVTDLKSGLPIEFAQTILMDIDGNVAVANTNDTGYYELDAFDGADMGLFVQADGYSQVFTYITLSPGDEIWQDFDLWPVSAWLEGTITDVLTGVPIENAWVWAESSDYSEGDETDATGYYNMSLVPGDYTVRVNAMDYREQDMDVTVVDEMTTVQDFELIPWDIEDTVLVFGYVTDSDSADPIMGAQVRMAFPDMSYQNSTYTDMTGYYEIYTPSLDGMPAGATAYQHAPSYGTFDCAGLASLSFDFQLDPDMYAPNLTYDQSPLENVSWTNAMTIYAEIEDHNLAQILLFNFAPWYSDGGYDYLYIIEGASVSFDPFGPSSGLPYSQDGDNYTVYDEFNGTLDDASVIGGWLDNGTDAIYLSAFKQWWGPNVMYALRAHYSNSTLSDMSGAAYFDSETGEYMFFHFDSGYPEAEPDDPSGVITMMTSGISIEHTDPGNWMWLSDVDLGASDVADLTFVSDPVVPSGGYATLFGANDFGNQGQMFVTPYSVDNEPPIADAGPDLDVAEGAEGYLNASGSSDNVGIESYAWEFDDDGVPVTSDAALFYYTFMTMGTYDVTLTVVDGAGHESSDTMTVTVFDGEAPVANAGIDQEVSYGETVTFDGSLSSDNVDVTSWDWTFEDDGSVTRTGETVDYEFTAPGEYTVTLTVADDVGNEDTDTMNVTVVDDEAPVADAGADPVGVVAGDVVPLDGSGSSDNYQIEDYTWTFTDGTVMTLDGPMVNYTFENEGEFTITLTVTDAAGLNDTDEVVVRVGPSNEGPDADAGDDMTVTEGDTVEFDGSASSDDVGIESYTWTFEYDGEIETLTGESAEFVFEMPGTYIVTLNVTDAEGEWDTDMVVVIVEQKASTFLTDYWWLLAAVAAIVVIGALVLLMKGGKGSPGPAKKEDAGEEFEDEDLPPPDDEDF